MNLLFTNLTNNDIYHNLCTRGLVRQDIWRRGSLTFSLQCRYAASNRARKHWKAQGPFLLELLNAPAFLPKLALKSSIL